MMYTNYILSEFAQKFDSGLAARRETFSKLQKWMTTNTIRRAGAAVDSLALSPCRVINLMNKALAKDSSFSDDEKQIVREALAVTGFAKIQLRDCYLVDGVVSVLKRGVAVPAPRGFRGVLASIKTKKQQDDKVSAAVARAASKSAARAAREASRQKDKDLQALIKELKREGHSFAEAVLLASKKLG